jgi:hypothetical protein
MLLAFGNIVLAMPKKTSTTKTPTRPNDPKAPTAPAKTKATAANKPSSRKAASVSSATTPTGAAPPLPSQNQLQTVLTYPMLTSADIRSVTHPAAGYETVANEAMVTWESLAGDFKVPGLSFAALQQALATRNTLAPIEQAIEPFYERARCNRIKADSDAWAILLALVRAVKAAGSPELAARFKPLIDWITASHSPKKPTKKKTPTNTKTT